MTVKTSKRESKSQIAETTSPDFRRVRASIARLDVDLAKAPIEGTLTGARPGYESKRYLSYIPMNGDDQVVVDDNMSILTLRTKVGSVNNEVTIGRVYTTVVGCGPVLKQVKARLMSITLEQNPGNISMDDAILALGKGIEDFCNSYREMYGELMLWRPAWKFEYQEVGNPKVDSR